MLADPSGASETGASDVAAGDRQVVDHVAGSAGVRDRAGGIYHHPPYETERGGAAAAGDKEIPGYGI